MRDKNKPTPQSVYKEYDKGVIVNQQIDLYDTVRKNENFFIGKQWEGVEANGLPTPVFNLLKRVTMFQIATISSDNISMQANPLACTSEYPMQELDMLSNIIGKQFAALFERNKIVTKIRQFLRNAAVDGDGVTYSYFDPDIETGQDAKGDIVTEIIENTRVLFGNPNDRDVQSQPFIIIERRKQCREVRKMAKNNGVSEDELEQIVPDSEEVSNDMDALQDDLVTLLTYLWRDDDTGTIHSYICTKAVTVEKAKDLGLKLYPITWMPWDYVQDCYHGHALVSELIPNQVFINKMFAMTMLSLMTTAFPKVVYDKTRIPRWDSRVGAAIGVNGGDMNSIARIIDPAAVSPQIYQFIDLAVNYTQNFMGASDAALGDTRPDNTSAIIALQRASNAPLELVKLNLHESIEDLGRIYMDMMRENYGSRWVQIDTEDAQASVLFDFGKLKEVPLSLKLDVGASAYWSEITTVQTLDNLLMQGQIELIDYLERIPDGYVSKKQELINKIISLQRAQEMQMQQMQQAQIPPEGADIAPDGEAQEIEGGKGYSNLQRAINETGV